MRFPNFLCVSYTEQAEGGNIINIMELGSRISKSMKDISKLKCIEETDNGNLFCNNNKQVIL